jgi:hypothetical protein
MEKGKATLRDVLDANGNLARIEVIDPYGTVDFDIVWDEREEHTPSNVENFRKWAGQIVKRYGYNTAT